MDQVNGAQDQPHAIDSVEPRCLVQRHCVETVWRFARRPVWGVNETFVSCASKGIATGSIR